MTDDIQGPSGPGSQTRADQTGGGSPPDAGGDRQPERAKPRIGDTRPAPAPEASPGSGASGRGGTPAGGKPADGDGRSATSDGGGRGSDDAKAKGGGGDGNRRRRRRRRGGRGKSGGQQGGGPQGGGQQGGGRGRSGAVEAPAVDGPIELDEETLARRRGKERKGRPVGRYLMAVHVRPEATHVGVLEGRALIEHRVSRPQDDVFEINGNIYLARVQNVLPGMEAAFIDIGTPKNAVLYRGDVRYDKDDLDVKGEPRIEDVLKNGQTIICQVTKNPIGVKGARLTQEVSLPGRFVVFVPNTNTLGISKRLPDKERKRLRTIIDKARPKGHGVIVRTAAEHATKEELERDIASLAATWEQISSLAKGKNQPTLLYREPSVAVRFIREEFNKSFRNVLIDDKALFDEVRSYVDAVAPALADRVEYYDSDEESLPLFERFHVHEQLHKALDRKVWLPSGGSLIIERTEALTVIDVNTGKNVGRKSLEETVFQNNLEAADEIARQLRLRDIGGIIVIDFIDMEVSSNRKDVVRRFKEALARDKTRTQVFEISELGLVEMTRKRVGEGLVESLSHDCPHCEGRGLELEADLIDT